MAGIADRWHDGSLVVLLARLGGFAGCEHAK